MLLELAINNPTHAKITSYRWHNLRKHQKLLLLLLLSPFVQKVQTLKTN